MVHDGSSVFEPRYPSPAPTYRHDTHTYPRSPFLQLDKKELKLGTRVSLDITTLTIMQKLPREVDPTVYSMISEDPGKVSFSSVGGLNEQIRELREV